MNAPNVKDAIQFLNGPKRGLLGQIVSVDGDRAKVLSRDMDGTPHFFELSDADEFAFVGVAALGPKQNAAAETEQKPSLPPPLNPQELLEPLPPEVKVQPLNAQPEEEAPLMPKLKPLHKPGHRRIKPTRANPTPAPRPEVQRRQFIATVRNALGQETTVEIAVRLDDNPNRHNNVAIMKAIRTKAIQRAKPFLVLGWKLKEPPLVAHQTGSAGLES
jgi:hypothetical protein